MNVLGEFYLSYLWSLQIELETNDFDRMKAIQSEFPTKLSGKQFSGDDEVRSVGEIVLVRAVIDNLIFLCHFLSY